MFDADINIIIARGMDGEGHAVVINGVGQFLFNLRAGSALENAADKAGWPKFIIGEYEKDSRMGLAQFNIDATIAGAAPEVMAAGRRVTLAQFCRKVAVSFAAATELEQTDKFNDRLRAPSAALRDFTRFLSIFLAWDGGEAKNN